MSIGFLSIICLLGRFASTASGASGYIVSVLGTTEQVSAVIAACCPPLRYLFSRRNALKSRVAVDPVEDGRGRRGEGLLEEQLVETKTAWRFWGMRGFTRGEG